MPSKQPSVGAVPAVAGDLVEIEALGAEAQQALAHREELLDHALGMEHRAALVVGVGVLGVHRVAGVQPSR